MYTISHRCLPGHMLSGYKTEVSNNKTDNMSLILNKLLAFFGVSTGYTLLHWDINDLQIIIFLHVVTVYREIFQQDTKQLFFTYAHFWQIIVFNEPHNGEQEKESGQMKHAILINFIIS